MITYEIQHFWRDIYTATIRAGYSNMEACIRADLAVKHLKETFPEIPK